MNIYDALILKAVGGGGGTTVVANPEGEATDELEKLQVGSDIYEIPKDYEEMSNKPSINSVELIGNKTASELGLQAELDGTQTVSGNPITVTDAESMNAESVVVELEPKQDLHGYDHPWVGGSGKNKCPAYTSTETQHSVTIEGNSKGEISVNGTLDGVSLYGFLLSNSISLEAGTYTLNGTNPNGARLVLYDSSENVLADTDGTVQTFTLESTTMAILKMFVYAYIQYDEVVRPMIRKSTESADFAPYSNICPISGVDEVSVTRCGKNYYDQSKAQINRGVGNDGTLIELSGDNGYASDYMNVKPLTTYKYIALTSGGAGAVGIAFYDSDKNVLSWSNIYDVIANGYNITSPANAVYARCTMYINDGHYGYFGLESIYTGLEPYQGNTTTIDLDGTKYGGTLDVGSGILTLTHGSVTESDFTYQGGTSAGGLKWADYVTNNAVSNDSMCSELQKSTNAWGSTAPCYIMSDNTRIRVYGNFTSQQDFEDKYANLQVVYKLATPLTIHLTPTQIQMLENTNNISTDGTNITLKYQPNNVIGECKAYTDEQIEKVLPPLPTTDGTYHLSCEVTSGVGVLSWVSDS